MRRFLTDNGDPKPKDRIQAGAPRMVALALLTLAAIVLCAWMTIPFLPALAWALALAIVAHPLHGWLRTRIKSADVAAGLAVAIVTILLGVPSYLVLARLTKDAAQAGQAVDQDATEGTLRSALARVPGLEGAIEWARDNLDQEEIRKLFLSRVGDVRSFLEGSLVAIVQGMLVLLTLFYFFRDGGNLMAGVRELAPLSSRETEHLATRVQDSIYATIYGTFVTGLLQGVTGGLLFWLLGLPGPVLWGTILFVLGILPLVGGVLVWAPTSVYLILEGRLGAAALLVTWGVLMSGPICNFVYARCAGDRMRMHPLPTLFAYLGGLAVFGVTGMVLGPVALALTVGFIDLWRQRMVPASPPLEAGATAAPPACT